MPGDTSPDLGKRGTARVMPSWPNARVEGDGFGSLQDPWAENGVTGQPQGQGTVLWLRWDTGAGRSGANERRRDERLFWCLISHPVLWEKLWERQNGEGVILGAHFAWKHDVKSLSSWEYPLPVEASDFLISVPYYVEISVAKVLELLCER